jgi:uncharacterized spore protein YtfJ
MPIQDIINAVSDRIGAVATVNTAFGEPRVMDHKAIIPVAMVVGGFGAGGGEGKMPGDEESSTEGNGGGGGGGFGIRPLAVLEVSDHGTRIIPVLDYTKIILAGIGLIGGFMWMMARRRGREPKRLMSR